MKRRSFLQLGAIGAAAGLLRPPAFAAPARLRGLTVDAARLTERPQYYRRVIDFCRDWNLNALLFRLTDDQGSAFRFAGHPGLLTHDHALTPAEARALAEYGRRRGVTLIPEIESFGHTKYVTSVAKYAHLADTPPGGRSGFVGICPVHPDSLALMRDLYQEVAAAFPSPYLHGGCDEVNWGGSEMSQRALEKKSRAEIWADYLNALDRLCRDLGRQLVVWGDFVAHKEPAILQHLNRRVIVMDWQYYVTDPAPLAAAARQVMDAGMRVIGAPAFISCEWGPRAGALALRNVDAFADAYRALPGERCLGVIATNWIPSRYLQGSLWDAFAYIAVALHQGGAAARASAFPRFVEKFYRAKWDAAWQRMFDNLYRLTPGRNYCAPQWQLPHLPLASSSDDELRRSLAAPPVDPSPYVDLAAEVRALEKTVRGNRADFAAFALSADYLAHLMTRESQWRQAGDAGEALQLAEIVAALADRDRRMLARLEAEWDLGRFPDSRGKQEKLGGLTPYDQLLLQMRQAAAYSAELARDPARLRRLLAGA